MCFSSNADQATILTLAYKPCTWAIKIYSLKRWENSIKNKKGAQF